eukprot:GHVQ01026242.1.p1 GENE.GHVQ01026242.1~~GHVQ01026242.1.p1  ORF type:complete len:263 (+),score=23.40 GHVQ01026242.1:1179-1967(+)
MTFPLPSGVGVMPVNGLCAHPTLALFLVACSDNTLRYFSMNASQPLCIISSNNPRPTGSFDPQGWLFACTTERTVISICDCSSSQYDNGCVGQGGVKKIVSEGATMAVDVSQCIPAPTEFVCTLVFSPDSSNLVVGTNRHKLFCVDTIYPGKLVCFYQFENVTATAAEHPIPLALPVFSPDAEFLLCGGSDQRIHIWRFTGDFVAAIRGQATAMPKLMKFNPQRILLATAGTSNIFLWQPRLSSADLDTNIGERHESAVTTR